MTLLLLFIGTILFNIAVNLLSEDMSEWVTSAAEWCVRRYAARWPAKHAERMTEQCLADLADSRGILHTLKFVVGLWCGVGKLPVETASSLDASQPPPSTLHVNLGERIRLSDSESPVGGNVTVALTGVSATTGLGSLLPHTSPPEAISTTGSLRDVPFVSSYDASNDVVRMLWDARRRQIAVNSTPMSSAVLWFASTQAAPSTTT